MVLDSTDRPPTLYEQADTDLVLLSAWIAEMHERVTTKPFKWIGFSPVDIQGNYVPPLSPDEDRIQCMFDDLTRRIASLSCHVRLRARPAGHAWFKKWRLAYQCAERDMAELRVDIIHQSMMLVYFVGADTANNTTFDILYGRTFAAAYMIIRDTLPLTAGGTAVRDEYCRYLMNTRTRDYAKLPFMKHFFPGAASLSTAALVAHVAELFRLNLQRWDRSHALALPRVRRVLEVMAFELEPQFNMGVYDLTALLNE